MAISQLTKQLVAQQRRALKAKYDRNLEEIADLQAGLDRFKEINVTIKAQFDALKKDIAEPSAK